MITIAGRPVKVGDTLYHTGFQAWGTVHRLDNGSVEYHIEGKSYGNVRKLFITQGGNINGQRCVYWHEPVVLDMPKADISQVQDMVDFIQLKYRDCL